jgi:hypothetical protein
MNYYKQNVDINTRLQKSNYFIKKYYPNKVPVIIQKFRDNDNIPKLVKEKFLVPGNMKYTSLLSIIRKQMIYKINPSIAIYLLTPNRTILTSSDSFLDIYDKYKDKTDNLLYLYYTGENTFG